MLTDIKCKTAKPKARGYKLADSGGLYLEVLPGGGKSWRLAFRFDGKHKRLVFGLYPAISLADARAKRDEARRLLAAGVDPAQQKKLDALAASVRNATTFRAVAEEFLAKAEREGNAERTMVKNRWLLLDLAMPLAGRPISEITAPELLSVLRKVESRGKLETAKRLRSTCGQVFRYAIATGRAERDPSADLRGALTSPVVKHRAAITDPKKIGALWRAIGDYQGKPETRLALKFAVLTAARPGEVRCAEWSEFDFDALTWTVPAEKMKMRRAWRTPLSAQTMALLDELKPLSGHSRYLFPCVRTPLRPMSEGALVAALRRMGFGKDEISAHGFRATFSTLANESGVWNPDAIERALAHVEGNAVRAAYARGEFWEERARMAEWWSSELSRLAAGEQPDLVPLAAAQAA